jgi:hypothetical protein
MLLVLLPVTPPREAPTTWAKTRNVRRGSGRGSGSGSGVNCGCGFRLFEEIKRLSYDSSKSNQEGEKIEGGTWRERNKKV